MYMSIVRYQRRYGRREGLYSWVDEKNVGTADDGAEFDINLHYLQHKK